MTIEYILIAAGIVAFLVIAGLTYWAKRTKESEKSPDNWRLPGTGADVTSGWVDYNSMALASLNIPQDEATAQKVTETVTKQAPKKARIAKAKVELKKVTKASLVSKNKKPATKAKKLPVKKTTARKTTK